MQDRPIVRSIWLTLVALFLGQAAIAVIVFTRYAIAVVDAAWYLAVMPIMHIAIGVVLTALRDLFTNTDTGRRLSRVNFANKLSLVRLSSAPTVLWLVLLARDHPVGPIVVPLTAAVFLTDLLDGQISRRTHQTTQIGQRLDSSSDYTVLVVVSIALIGYDLISVWFFALVMIRLGFPLFGQAILLVIRRWKVPFRTSFLGKASVFAIMTAYAISLATLIDGIPDWSDVVQVAAEYAAGSLALVSLAEKVYQYPGEVAHARRTRDEV